MDKREQYIQKFARRSAVNLTTPQLKDLQYFSKEAEKGRAISGPGLVDYFKNEHGLTLSKYRLMVLAQQNGIKPWFGK